MPANESSDSRQIRRLRNGSTLKRSEMKVRIIKIKRIKPCHTISFVSAKDQHKSRRVERAVLSELVMGRLLICGNSKMPMRSKNILPITIQKICLRQKLTLMRVDQDRLRMNSPEVDKSAGKEIEAC